MTGRILCFMRNYPPRVYIFSSSFIIDFLFRSRVNISFLLILFHENLHPVCAMPHYEKPLSLTKSLGLGSKYSYKVLSLAFSNLKGSVQNVSARNKLSVTKHCKTKLVKSRKMKLTSENIPWKPKKENSIFIMFSGNEDVMTFYK